MKSLRFSLLPALLALSLLFLFSCGDSPTRSDVPQQPPQGGLTPLANDPLGELRVAVVLVLPVDGAWADTSGTPISDPVAFFDEMWFDHPQDLSLADLWDEQSYGRAGITGDVFGPYDLSTLQNPPPAVGDCVTDLPTTLNAWSDAADTVAANASDDIYTNYDVRAYVFPANADHCYFNNAHGRPGRIQLFSPVAIVHAHELMHTYEDQTDLHARGDYIDHAGYVASAYGDLSCIMGSVGNTYGTKRLHHANALHKYRLGWLQGSEVQTVSGTGTHVIDIATMERDTTASDPKLLRIENPVDPFGEDILVSYRYAISGTFDAQANLDLDSDGWGDITKIWWGGGNMAFGNLSIHKPRDPLGGNAWISSMLQKMVEPSLTWYSCDGGVAVTHHSGSDADGATVTVVISDDQPAEGGFTLVPEHVYGKGNPGEDRRRTFAIALGHEPVGNNCQPATFTLSTDLPSGITTNLPATVQLDPADEWIGELKLTFSGQWVQGDIDFTITASTTAPVHTIDATYTVDTTNPAAPAVVNAVETGCGDVTVSWQAATDNNGILEYRVYRVGGGLLGTVAAPGLSFLDESAPTGTPEYYVASVDWAGNSSSASSHAQATVPQAPTTPAGLSGDQSGSVVNLTWTASTDNCTCTLDYHVERDGQSLGTVTTTSFQDTSPGEGENIYSVVAEDDCGNLSGAALDTVAFDSTAPSTPAASAVRVNCDIHVSWTASSDSGSGVAEYDVLRNGVVITTVSSGTLSYVDVQPGAGVKTYRVRARDNEGNESGLSNKAKVTSIACWP